METAGQIVKVHGCILLILLEVLLEKKKKEEGEEEKSLPLTVIGAAKENH